MSRILITYATVAGSTAEVAHAVGEEIARKGVEIDVQPLDRVQDLAAYDGVVIGAPMIMGWHRAALQFVRKHRTIFKRIPLAVFITAISLTQTGETHVAGVPVIVDVALAKPPKQAGRFTLRERYATPSNYLRPILQAIRPARPVRFGLFGGRLEYGRMPWWAVLFVMLVIQAPTGDRRNWPAIRAWAAELPAAFQINIKETNC